MAHNGKFISKFCLFAAIGFLPLSSCQRLKSDLHSPLSDRELVKLEREVGFPILLPKYLPPKFKSLPYKEPIGPGSSIDHKGTIILKFAENQYSAGEFKPMANITVWQVGSTQRESRWSPNIDLYESYLKTLGNAGEKEDRLYRYKSVDINGHQGVIIRGLPISDVVTQLNECSLTFRAGKTLVEMKSNHCDTACELELIKVARSMEAPHADPADLKDIPIGPSPRVKAAITENMKVLRGADKQSSYAAANKLSEIGASAVPELVEALRDPNPMVRQNALGALQGMGENGKEAGPAVIDCFSDSDEQVRGWAGHAIARIDPTSQEAVPVMIRALKDKSPFARKLTAFGLGRMRPVSPDIIEALSFALDDADEGVRVMALAALWEIGPAANKLEPKLKQMLQDKNPDIRKNAQRTLSKLKL